ncbi:hypothetical protein RJT34_01190 [Clitoria ternatea]|uniref:Uncharacterized protein n=1 Tax=Clitoria ternatea TaxID=43366 RepID=A0AAN9KJ92_CLITE
MGRNLLIVIEGESKKETESHFESGKRKEHQTMQQQQKIEASSHIDSSASPSFSSYSSETLAEIAARVIQELRRDPHDDDDALFAPWQNDDTAARKNDDLEENDEFEFEFAFVSRDLISPVSADDIFYNGQIRPIYPIFGLHAPTAFSDDVPSVSALPNNEEATTTRQRRLPLRKLMLEEGETASCSSSTDESVELEEGTYCVWSPNSVGRERRKSNSTGSASKRWKLRDLLLRSHSDGKKKQQVMFQIPNNKVAAKNSTGSKDLGDQTKRKSFLPYRPEVVGLFSNVNGLGRNLRPF